MINLSSDCIIMLMLIWIIFVVCSGYINICFILTNKFILQINSTFIEIFYDFIIKKLLYRKHISLEMRFVKKIKVSEICTENNFHFRIFVRNLSKYITLQYCWNVSLQYNKKRTSQHCWNLAAMIQ